MLKKTRKQPQLFIFVSEIGCKTTVMVFTIVIISPLFMGEHFQLFCYRNAKTCDIRSSMCQMQRCPYQKTAVTAMSI